MTEVEDEGLSVAVCPPPVHSLYGLVLHRSRLPLNQHILNKFTWNEICVTRANIAAAYSMAGANVIRLPPVFVVRPFSFIHDPPQLKMWVSTGSEFPLSLFVVARVQGRYRCIAAFHAAAKSLYGADVITAVARILRAFENPFNMQAISTELEVLASRDSDSDDSDPAILCPYLTGVVFSAFRVDFSPVSYDSKTLYVLPHQTMPSARKFSEAYAVFDISAPGDVRYCFLDEVPKGSPLDATQYMKEYLRDPHDRRTYSEDMEYLRKLTLLSPDVLSATWPEDFAADASTPTLDMALAPGPDAMLSLSQLSLQAALRELLRSEGTVTDDVLAPILACAAKNAEIITRELLRVSEPLNENGLRLLRSFVAPASETNVDLSLWLRSGVLVADQLESLADGMQDATVLNVSSCATLTSAVLTSLVARMPHLQHVIALDCPMLGKPTVPLALSSLLESKDLTGALRFRNMRENGEGFKDCVHYVDPSDPPPGLTVLFYTRRIVIGGVRPREVRRYGVELSTFGVTGVAHGFTTLLRMLSHHDLIYFLGFTGLNFVMRAAFQGLDARGSLGSLPPLVPVGTPSDNEGPPFSFLSHTPGQNCDALPPRSERVFLQGFIYPDDSVPPPAPRHPGWVLMLDSQAGIPDLPYWQIGQRPLLDTIRANKKDDTLYRPLYGFVRWAYDEDGSTLVPKQVCNLQEWAAQLPAGHGQLDDEQRVRNGIVGYQWPSHAKDLTVAEAWEDLLENLQARLMPLEEVATSGSWSSELWEPLERDRLR